MVTIQRFFLSMMIGVVVCSLGCQLNAMKLANPRLTSRMTLASMNFSPFSYNMAYWHAKVRNIKEKINQSVISDEMISEAQSLAQEAKSAGQMTYAKQIEEMISKAKKNAADQTIEEHTRKIKHYKKVYGEQTAQNKDLETEITKLRSQLAQANLVIQELRETSNDNTNKVKYYEKSFRIEQERAQKAEAKVAEQDKTIEWLQCEHLHDDAYNQQLALELNKAKITLQHTQKEITALSDEMFLLKTEAAVSETMLQIASEEEKSLKIDALDHAKYATSIYNREAQYVEQIRQLKQELTEAYHQNHMLIDKMEHNIQDIASLATTSNSETEKFNQLKIENTTLHQSIRSLEQALIASQKTTSQLREQLDHMTSRYMMLCGNIMQIATGKANPERALMQTDLQTIASKITALAGISITVKKLEDNIMKVLVSPDAQKYKTQIVQSLSTIKQALSRNKL